MMKSNDHTMVEDAKAVGTRNPVVQDQRILADGAEEEVNAQECMK